MAEVVYSGTFPCLHCDADIAYKVHSDSNIDGEDEIKRSEEMASHFHWVHFHRVCAVCGELVASGELEVLAPSELLGSIHSTYLDWARGGDMSLLTLHQKCFPERR